MWERVVEGERGEERGREWASVGESGREKERVGERVDVCMFNLVA